MLLPTEHLDTIWGKLWNMGLGTWGSVFYDRAQEAIWPDRTWKFSIRLVHLMNLSFWDEKCGTVETKEQYAFRIYSTCSDSILCPVGIKEAELKGPPCDCVCPWLFPRMIWLFLSNLASVPAYFPNTFFLPEDPEAYPKFFQ